MRILEILYSLSTGGAERFVVDLSNEMANGENELYLCCLRDDTVKNHGFYKSDLREKVVYINLNLPEGFRLSNVVAIKNLLEKVQPDVVHCHLNLVNYIFPLTFIFTKIKFFHTIHTDPPREVKNLVEFIIRKFFYLTNKVNAITISNETSRSFVDYYKIKNFTQIYNGRAIPTKSDEFEQVRQFICKLRNLKNVVFLHIGRCNSVKNQNMLIRVFNRLITEGKPVILLIIGAGFETIEGEKLKSIAADKIFFLGEKRNTTDYYFNSDAFCLSSVQEGMPITLIESLACGCTPICTPVGGIIDTVENEETGFVSKSVSESDYYQAIIDFLENPNLIEKNKLIEKYFQNFSINKCAKQYIDLFRSS